MEGDGENAELFMQPGIYGREFEDLMCDLKVAFTMRHYPRLPFPNELERLIRYDKWVSREAFREHLESILFREFPHLERKSAEVKWPHFPEELEAVLAIRFPGECDPEPYYEVTYEVLAYINNWH